MAIGTYPSTCPSGAILSSSCFAVVTQTALSPIARAAAPGTADPWLVNRLLPTGVVGWTVFGGILEGTPQVVVDDVPDLLISGWSVVQPIIARPALRTRDVVTTDRRLEDMAPLTRWSPRAFQH